MVSEKRFRDQQELAAWLRGQGVNEAAWGLAGAKSLNDLWHEYNLGEITFDDDPPARHVRVVQIILTRGEDRLLEIAQEFGDGRTRRRLMPPSEKLLAGESARTAAHRCLFEELNLGPAEAHFLTAHADVQETESNSPSYPGLRTRYTIYTFQVAAPGLPAGEFWRDNKAAAMGDPVKRHLFGWRRVA